MFQFGFNSYMNNAYPQDELDPLNCRGRSRDSDENNLGLNDVLGGFSLTLIDSLDSLAIMGLQEEFEDGVRKVIQNVTFDLDSRVQIFEVTIRVLGGLLSAHLFASNNTYGTKIDWYNGELLDLAVDLGNRMLPAFDTPFGLPYPRINLRHGLYSEEVQEACTAGAGTLILEFGALSRLTGNPQYEAVAKRAMLEIWSRRSEIDLVGNTMRIFENVWVDTISGVGAGIDSFYEYLFKGYILLGDQDYYEIHKSAYAAAKSMILDRTGFILKNVRMENGAVATNWIDSLSAFFPGFQVLVGEVSSAINPHFLFFTIWEKYSALPERFDIKTKNIAIDIYPLRPELMESTYMLYQATKNNYYLNVGERMLNDIETYCKTKCGYAGLKNLMTKEKDDRMESFFLSETLKYLFLLFDTGNFELIYENPVNLIDSNAVFTTEGHLLYLPYSLTNKSKGDSDICENILPEMFQTGPPLKFEWISAVKEFIGEPDLEKKDQSTLNSFFETVNVMLPLFPGGLKGTVVKFGNQLLVDSMRGLLLNLVEKENTISCTKIDGYHVGLDIKSADFELNLKVENNIDIFGIVSFVDPISNQPIDLLMGTALFGPILKHGFLFTREIAPLLLDTNSKPIFENLSYGCELYSISDQLLVFGKIALVRRGKCQFLEKVANAQFAGAVAVFILEAEGELISMAADKVNRHFVWDNTDLITIPSFFCAGTQAQALLHLGSQPVTVKGALKMLMGNGFETKQKLSFSGKDIEQIIFFRGNFQLPSDNLYRNNYYTFPFQIVGQQCELFCRNYG